MGLFVNDNDPHFVAAESLAAAELRYYEADRAVDECEKEVEKAEKDNDESTFKGGSKIALTYDKLYQAEQSRDAALHKLEWERRQEWKRRIPTDSKRTKQLMAGIDWKNIRKP